MAIFFKHERRLLISHINVRTPLSNKKLRVKSRRPSSRILGRALNSPLSKVWSLLASTQSRGFSGVDTELFRLGTNVEQVSRSLQTVS